MVVNHSRENLSRFVFKTMMLIIVAAFGLMGCARGAEGDVIAFEALLAEQPVADSSPGNPIKLHHEEVVDLTMLMTNTSDRPVTVAHVRLEGGLLGLIFLTYDTGINETLQPGEARVIRFPLDFFDLEGQAHGLLRGHLRVFDEEREPLGSEQLFIDGRGSVLSTMSVFNLVLAGFAAASFAWNLLRLSRRQLPATRVLRGLRFLYTGGAIGLTISAAFSVLRIWPLPTPAWVMITLVAAIGGFVAGYLSPGADDVGQFPVINLTDSAGEAIRIPNSY